MAAIQKTLNHRNDIYTENQKDWNFYTRTYIGGRKYVESILLRHPRESVQNYLSRRSEGYNFNYATSIIDLFNFYLTEKTPVRELAGLEDDVLWEMFERDCDLTGTNFDSFLTRSQKLSSVSGTSGILVNKAGKKYANKQGEVNARVYPYCSLYTMPNILDWTWGIDKQTNRPVLEYLMLREDDELYHLWYPNGWQIWQYKKYKTPRLLSSGKNPLGVIPFVWLPNIKTIDHIYLGESDIKEVSLIVASIVRNLSYGEEVIKFGGFPMMRMPMEAANSNGPSNSNSAGPTAILEFDPEKGDGGKPDWLESEVADPVDAILKWIDRKADEIYRVCHLSGVHGQRKSNNEVASGLALRYEFQQLNAVLGQKTDNLCEAEMNIIRYWLLWQNEKKLADKINVTRTKHFSVDDLAIEIDNIVQAIKAIASETFGKAGKKIIAKHALPDMTDKEVELVNAEIDSGDGTIPLEIKTDADVRSQ
jgi:hypothetical protein